ncbi:MAG: 3-deoxy-D-manno-octulosonic acid transferase [Muribaculaceae bacterium]|nr:3-deoxy-D-manno-octulosonic acid transferase [Muribaculaceae bacterium]
MNPLYNAGINLYSCAARVAGAFSEKPRIMVEGQKETLDYLTHALASDKRPVKLWMHVASLGEFEQGRPILERFRAAYPDCRMLVTFFSPSGYRSAIKHSNDSLLMAYLPFDTPANAKAMVNLIHPEMAIFVKYEFWGNYLHALADAGVPTYLVSAVFRPGQIFFRPWGGEFRSMLRCFKHIYLQDEASKQLLAGIGIDNTTVAGDTRFDRVTTIRSNCKALPAIDIFTANAKGSFTLVAGSSWGRDEAVYFPTLAAMPDVSAIIAPHEFDKSRLDEMLKSLGPEAMLYTDFEQLMKSDPTAAAERARSLRFLIVNTFGLLSSIYRYADTAYIGGGFGAGIHNINEAAVYGIPVAFGPRHEKFIEARELIAAGGGFEIKDAASFEATMQGLTSDSEHRHRAAIAAGQYIASKIGATDRICAELIP